MSSETNLKIALTGNLGRGSAQSQAAKKLQVAPCIELGATFVNTYYLGLRVTWRYSGAKSTSMSPVMGLFNFSHNFTMNQYADFLLKMGYMLAPRTMVYGLAGPSLANWTHTTNFIKNQVLVDKFKFSKTSLGGGIGVGIEHFFPEKYAVSVDYTHYFHRTVPIKQEMGYNYLGVRSGDLVKAIRPSYSTIAIRLTTYFQL